MQLAAMAPTRPNPTEYDRFRNHVGAAFAQLEEAKWEAKVSRFVEPDDITDAIRTAQIAVYKLEKALDLGYQNSDDAGSFALYAIEQAQTGIDALAPFKGVKFESAALPAGLEEAMDSAHQSFADAQQSVMESLHAMHD